MAQCATYFLWRFRHCGRDSRSAGSYLDWRLVSAAAGERTAFILTLLAALSFLGMLALFAFGNNPLNQQIATWTPETLPANWREVRDAWDRFHAMISVLAALAFTVLLVDILRQMPSSWQAKHARRGASTQAE